MEFGAVIVGDEILTGRRQDCHRDHLVQLLHARDQELAWCRYVGDDLQRLAQTFRETLQTGDTVFSFGGIGATPDDRTRQAMALALNKPLEPHAEAIREIEAQFGEAARPLRVKMAEFPAGSEIIPNPVNRVAGFSHSLHFFVPGFPQMAWPMVEWVLDTKIVWNKQESRVLCEVRLPNAKEGALIPTMEALLEKFPMIKLSCLPKMNDGYYEVTLAISGRGNVVKLAFDVLIRELSNLEYELEILP